MYGRINTLHNCCILSYSHNNFPLAKLDSETVYRLFCHISWRLCCKWIIRKISDVYIALAYCKCWRYSLVLGLLFDFEFVRTVSIKLRVRSYFGDLGQYWIWSIIIIWGVSAKSGFSVYSGGSTHGIEQAENEVHNCRGQASIYNFPLAKSDSETVYRLFCHISVYIRPVVMSPVMLYSACVLLYMY